MPHSPVTHGLCSHQVCKADISSFIPTHQPADTLPLPASLASATTGCPFLLAAPTFTWEAAQRKFGWAYHRSGQRPPPKPFCRAPASLQMALEQVLVPGVEGTSPQLTLSNIYVENSSDELWAGNQLSEPFRTSPLPISHNPGHNMGLWIWLAIELWSGVCKKVSHQYPNFYLGF